MSDCRIVVIGLVIAACLPWAQATTITELGHTADLIVVARLDRIDRKAETTSTGSRYGTAQLSVIQVIKGSSASQMLQAAIVSSRKPCFAAGGSGPGPCFSLFADMPVSTGIWFLKSVDGAWEIIPKQLHGPVITYDDLFLPLTGNPDAVPAPGALDDRLLAYEVRWFQSLADPDIHSIDEPFYSCFQDRNSQSPTQQQVLRAIAPLIASRYPGQHAAGLVLALRFDSVDAMNQVVNELPALRSNPRFPEILSAIGSAPPGGNKDPRFVVPLRQLIALNADVPGLDAAMAAALYRIGTRETWPLLGELLESKDAYAQTVAARTLDILVPAQEAPGNDHRLPYEVAFWKAWWAGNRARLGFAGVASTAKNSAAPAGVLPPPFINPDGVIRGDTNRPGMFPPGTLIGIWGHNFGPAAGCHGDGPTLCGVQVLLDGQPIAIQFVTDVQINARIPDDTPGQPVSRLTVVSGGRTSDPVVVRRMPETATIALEGVARADGPVWIHVELPLRVSCPPTQSPWDFACDAFEVRKDGIPLTPIAPSGHGGGIYSGPPCPGFSGTSARSNRLPLHLQFRFTAPGIYEVRLLRYDGFTRQTRELRIQSDWTRIEVLPAVLRTVVPAPADAEELLTDYLPNLLAVRDDETLAILETYLYDQNPRVRSYAMNALYYWPDSVVVPQLLQAVRDKGPVSVAMERLAFHATEIVDAALPYLTPDDPLRLDGALAVMRGALSPKVTLAPELRARMEESLIAAFNNIGRMEAQPVNDLISVLGQVGGEPVHELLWSFVDRGGAGGRGLDQALNAIAWQKDPKDLPRLADYLIAVQADDRSGNSFAVVPNVLRAQFGDAATPALRDVMEKAQSQAIRLRSAEELLYARARAGFAFALDAMQQNRPWKAQIARFVTDQFPEARGSDAAMLQFLTDRSKESAAR